MSSFPDWLVPMAATLTQERFASPDWTFERKYDGIRLITFKRGGDVRMYSRNHLPQHVPAIETALARLPHDELILDGELAWDQREYHVFDVLWCDGDDLRQEPLVRRREVLARIPLRSPLERTLIVDDAEPWLRAATEGWEGVIAKRLDSVYEHKRSKAWLKMKVEATQELVVGGFTDPRGKRIGLGALLVGYYDGDDLVFAGKVGTGLDTKLLVELRRRFDAIEIPRAPFTRATGLPRAAHWVTPEVVVQVSFMEWTSGGKLRHPRLVGVRYDKTAHEVTRER